MRLEDAIITTVSGRAVPILGDDIDTDRIVPARFLKEITFANMGNYLFYDLRFDETETPKAHPLNDPHYLGARIMIVGRNFGCGSSREHAPQAIKRFGIQAVIGESFAEIFAGNCKAIGLPVVSVSDGAHALIIDHITHHSEALLSLNLDTKTLQYGAETCHVELPEARRQAFISGTWESTALLRVNMPAVLEKAKQLPYVQGFAS